MASYVGLPMSERPSGASLGDSSVSFDGSHSTTARPRNLRQRLTTSPAMTIGVGAAILFFVATVLGGSRHREAIVTTVTSGKWSKAKPISPTEAPYSTIGRMRSTVDGPSFYEIAKKHGTDKVTTKEKAKGTHQYQLMYDKYLPAVRNRRVKMLEIGLGCDMLYGPGKSYYTWLEYFPNVDLYYIEYDAACAAKWADRTTGATIYAGDQADVAFLERFIAETTSLERGGLFDIIVDDGGHTMKQQMTSLQHLWRAVKPGGVYFVEDLQTSFWTTHYGGDDPTSPIPNRQTMAKMVHDVIDDGLQPEGTRWAMSKTTRSVECMREVCAFVKVEQDARDYY